MAPTLGKKWIQLQVFFRDFSKISKRFNDLLGVMTYV